jgi:hypothetical protein
MATATYAEDIVNMRSATFMLRRRIAECRVVPEVEVLPRNTDSQRDNDAILTLPTLAQADTVRDSPHLGRHIIVIARRTDMATARSTSIGVGLASH